MVDHREFQADFESGTDSLNEASLDRRPDAISLTYLTSFTVGPDVQGDASVGVLRRTWKVRDVGGTIKVARATDAGDGWEAETDLFTYTGAAIVELDCAFEQAGRIVVVAERPTGAGGSAEIWIYWYDPSLANFTFDQLGEGRTPRCVLDNPYDPTDSDILLFYINDTNDAVAFRQQRDRYATEYLTPIVDTQYKFVEDAFRTADFRSVVIISVHDPVGGTYVTERLESTLYPVPVGPDEFQVGVVVQSGELRTVIIDHQLFDIGKFQISPALVSGDLLALGSILLYDVDNHAVEALLQSGTLVSVLILHTLYDVDEYQPNILIQSGILVVVVIVHTLYDVDQYQPNVAIQSGTLA